MVEEVEHCSADFDSLTLRDMEGLVNAEIGVEERRPAEIGCLTNADLAELRRGEAVEVDVLIGLEVCGGVAGKDGQNAVGVSSIVGSGADGMAQGGVLDGKAEVLAGVGLEIASRLPCGDAGEVQPLTAPEAKRLPCIGDPRSNA